MARVVRVCVAFFADEKAEGVAVEGDVDVGTLTQLL
jgi:hypothetical protein